MQLSRATKARILRRLNPRALIYGTMIVALVVLGLQLIHVIATLFGHSLGLNWLGSIFLLALPVHGFRWWALRQGWSAVNVHEANVSNLARQVGLLEQSDIEQEALLGETGSQLHHRTATFQQAVANKAAELGWLSWRDVLDAANEAGIPVEQVREPLFLGGHGAIARPLHWRKALLPQAWASVDLNRALPAASGPVMPRARF